MVKRPVCLVLRIFLGAFWMIDLLLLVLLVCVLRDVECTKKLSSRLRYVVYISLRSRKSLNKYSIEGD